MRKRLFSLLAALCLISTAAWADLPFRNHRYDAFKVLTVTPNDIVFIGNSITNMHEWWEAFGSNHHILNRGVSGAVSDEVVANLESMIAGKPRKVFLMIGTNDLGTDGLNTVEHVTGNVRIILDRIQKESPATEIYVQSILPSGLRDQNLQKATNAAIREICTEKEVTYIDLWDKLLSVASGQHTQDRLHLTASGYQIWCKEIAQYVGAESVYIEGAPDLNSGLGGSNGMRSSYFGGLGVKQDDILIIGDEMIHGGEWHELLNNAKVKNRGTAWGYPGPSLADVKAQIPTILKGRADNGTPAQIYLYAGTADVNNTNNTIDAVETNYRSVIDAIRKDAPGVPLYLMSLMPRSNAANTTRVIEMNNKLKAIAESEEGIEYVDIFTPLSANGMTNTAYFNGDYLYGKGYAKVAQVLAQTIPGSTAVTDSQAAERNALLNARNTIGAAIGTIRQLSIGEGPGQYLGSDAAEALAAIDPAYALLADETASAQQFLDRAAVLNALVTALLPKINMPALSTDGNETWYKFSAARRGNRLMSGEGAGADVIGREQHNYANGMWKLTARTGGDGWDIINRADGTYLSPASGYNTAIKATEAVPAKGWKLSYANTPGMYIIHSGNVELNQAQSALGFKLYNWSTGQSGTDRADDGCQFVISPAGTPDEVPTEPEPLFTLTDIRLDGSHPFRIHDDLARDVMSLENLTVVVDFTQPAAQAAPAVIVGSSDEDGTNFFGIVTRENSKYGVQFIGSQGTEGWYTQAGKNFTLRTKIAVVMTKAAGYTYYFGGAKDRDVPASGLGAYGYHAFGNYTGASGLYLGGLIVGDNADKYPLTGTIHSVRFYDRALSADEIATLSYDNLVPTSVTDVTAYHPAAGIYTLGGRRVAKTEKGIYVIDGKKVKR